ncbi:MAG TPA: ATP-dependent protease ATPase subunit HslU [Candidatus Sumerlaeota bacterium]|nr:ATP-dependent protease ATPase subunit HslU [Candidatus Sumerlaeota bacterium]
METRQPKVEGLTPKEIVAELDKYIIGQQNAKRMVAIALRNRARRKLLPDALRDEVSPKNILMIGPTGVGKTEISRRLSRLAGAPFLKVEASKYTEVGYVGRDVESMVRDLMEIGIKMVREERTAEVIERATDRANERLLDLLLPQSRGAVRPPEPPRQPFGFPGIQIQPSASSDDEAEESREKLSEDRWVRTREKLRQGLLNGAYEDREVEFKVSSRSGGMPGNVFGIGLGNEREMMGQVQDMIERMMPQQPKEKRLPIRLARQILVDEEVDRLLDMDKIVVEALDRVQQSGIIFIDEIDKIAGRGSGGQGPDVSREGVQRDILPIVEGCTVNTKYGMVSTEHILFVGSGAFHVAKPSDLIPELQGRFPLRVELDSLGKEEFRRILTEPDNALTKQYAALLETEEVGVTFSDDGIEQLAECAHRVNQQTENIGARRLHTVMEKVFEEISFEASDTPGRQICIDRDYVNQRLKDIIEDEDLSKFIL